MSGIIRGIGTAVPEHVMDQPGALKMFQDLTCVDPRQRRLAKVLFDRAQVQRRHTFVPYQSAYQWCAPQPADRSTVPVEQLCVPPSPRPELEPGASPGLTTGQRSQLYAKFAGELACQSAENAIEQSGIARDEITHLVTVSCTGFAAPGVCIEMLKTLPLAPTVERVNVGFMGCHGAINGLRVANSLATANPDAVVLMTAVELCSLHCRFQWDSEKIIGNALFADGSASLIMQGRAGHSAQPGNWEVIDTASVLIPDSQSALSWHVGDHGFEMVLTSEIGDKIESTLCQWVDQWLATHDLGLDDIAFWGVHPGGPKIIEAVKTSLQLEDSQLATSMDVLKNYGNMSSPTVLFILDAFTRQLAQSNPPSGQRQYCLMVAFGPGMIAEIALLAR